MHISTLSVRKPITIMMMTLAIAIIGFVSLPKLGLDLLPKIEYPAITVMTSYPGIAPEEIETLLTKPIEDAVSTVKNVKNVRSTSTEGMSVIVVDFEWGVDIDLLSQDVRDKIGQIQDRLPSEASTPLALKFDTSGFPIAMYTVTSDSIPPLELKQLVEDLFVDDLKRIDGVAQINVTGGLEREIQVLIDKMKLDGYNLPINLVIAAIAKQNINISAGHLEIDESEYLIRSKGEFESIEDIKKIPIINFDYLNVIYLEDIAEVRDTHEEVRGIIETDGVSSIMLMINKESEANIVDTVENIQHAIPELSKKLPEDTKIQLVMDQSELIVNYFNNATKSAFIGLILAGLMIFLFLKNWRPTLTIFLTIPLSVLGIFIGMVSLGYTFNMMTLGALTLGIGMLVDNAVVVIENIFRRMEEKGEDRFTASEKGTTQVIHAITASTMTTVIVFLPMALAGGIASKLAQPLSFTIIIALLASLLMAVTFVPMMASKLFKASDKSLMEKNKEGKIMNLLKKLYQIILRRVLKLKFLSLLVILSVFVGSLFLIPIIGSEFMPTMDQSIMIVDVELPQGKTLEETEQITNKVADYIQEEEGVESVSTVIGVAGSSDTIVISGDTKGVNTASIFVKMENSENRDLSSAEIANNIRQKVSSIEGATIKFQDMGSILLGGGESDIEIKVFGKDLETLKAISNDIKEIISSIEGVEETDTSFREGAKKIEIKIDRPYAGAFGVSSLDIGSTINTAFLGTVVSKLREQGKEEVNIRLKFSEEDTLTAYDIGKLQIYTSMGAQIDIGQVTSTDLAESPAKIFRENQSRKGTITAKIFDRDLGTVMQDVEAALSTYELPQGYSIEYGGTYENMQETFFSLFIALIISILLLYMVMAAQFESLVHPLTIITTVPLGIIGVLFALFITNLPLSLPAFMGLIILGGIIVNNAIVFVDFVKYLRTKGVNKLDALMQAGNTRLRPILITTLTTIFGMLPMAIGIGEGAESQQPMAVAVIGGLIVGTVLTLIVVPIVYTIFDDISERVKYGVDKVLHG